MFRNIAAAAIATIQDYPSIAAGICMFAVAFALVAGNALYGQPGGHPGPLFATRDNVTTRSVGVRRSALPVHKVRTETVVPTEIPVPSIRPDAVAAQAQAEAPLADPVRQAQQALKEIGLYSGEVDGLSGPMTRAAIIEFENKHGLEPDGEVTETVLAVLARSAPGRERARAPVAARAAVPDQETGRPVAQKASLVEESAAFSQSAEEIRRAARIARIQIGLMNFGESDIAVDGVLGPRTVEAIRAFQQRYKLPVTGEPDEAVIGKLEQIGALKKS